jgi:prepilin-type N-terminal cleavage/methylation domain-containing protein
MNNKGFSLLEIVIAVGVIGILGVVFTLVLTNVFRSETQIDSISEFKQTGQVVLDRLDREIRDSSRVVCIGDKGGSTESDSGDTIVMQKKDGSYIRVRFDLENNGFINVEHFIVGADRFLGGVGSRCVQDAFIEGENILDEYRLTGAGVSVVNGNFSKTQPVGFREAVSIRFELSAGMGAAGQENAVFQSTILLR